MKHRRVQRPVVRKEHGQGHCRDADPNRAPANPKGQDLPLQQPHGQHEQPQARKDPAKPHQASDVLGGQAKRINKLADGVRRLPDQFESTPDTEVIIEGGAGGPNDQPGHRHGRAGPHQDPGRPLRHQRRQRDQSQGGDDHSEQVDSIHPQPEVQPGADGWEVFRPEEGPDPAGQQHPAPPEHQGGSQERPPRQVGREVLVHGGLWLCDDLPNDRSLS
jgi:hypothetical protein